MNNGRRAVALIVSLIAVTFDAGFGASKLFARGLEFGQALDYALSPPVRSLPAAPADIVVQERPPRVNPLAGEPNQGQRGTWNRPSVPNDPLLMPSAPGLLTPVTDLTFEGVGNPLGCGGCSPPDTNGDVGPSHYVQIVNATKVSVYNKSGTLLAPAFNLGSLWSSGTCASNAGDPVALYDSQADRWVLAQFAGPNHMCFAISQTGNPLGSYHLFTFDVGSFPDYFKLGVWPNAYYMSANESTYTSYAFDRSKMLVGDPTATFVKFTGQTNFLLPGDLDGPTLPASGSPGIFYTFKDDAFHGGVDRIEVFELSPNFVTPGSSTFTMVASLPIAPFTYTVCGFFNFDCARQRGTTQRIDVVSEWPMHRFPYRNFGTHQTLVGNFTVGGGTGSVGAAIRWFELRNTGSGWTLFQEGTHNVGDGHDRFMGSIAVDQFGNIALGYSVSSRTLFPAIRFATRAPGDPAGALQAESVLINGGGSQTGSNRWGDYSAMSVDPADNCSFWYTNEYYPVNSTNQWKTRIGRFKMSGCGAGGNQSPIAEANGPYSGAVNTAISFSSAGSTDPDGGIATFSWNFGDGSPTNNLPNPTHTYTATGNFTATLTVTDNLGATGMDTAPVTVTRTRASLRVAEAIGPSAARPAHPSASAAQARTPRR